jgi:hypothetical protein
VAFIANGLAEVRFDEKGKFDELCIDGCNVHFEMMDDKTLWIGIRPLGRDEEVHVTVSAKGNLSVIANEA